MSRVSEMATISNSNGLHARPAGKIVALANQYDCDVTLELNGNVADCRSIIALMTLTATCGSEVEVAADGDKADEAVAAIVELIKGRFEEE